MKLTSIQAKTTIVLVLIAISAIVSSVFVIQALNRAEDDAEIVNALGRQRMLSQAMAKSVLGYAMAKNSLQSVKMRISTLDEWITKMRQVYTDYVAHPFHHGNVQLSMTPTAGTGGTLPFPATFARLVSESFTSDTGVSVDIISRTPINPKKGLLNAVDKDAFTALSKQPGEIFSSITEQGGGLDVLIYTADIATTKLCASCHESMLKMPFKVGDLLGIRKYRVHFADSAALGKAELEPSLEEFKVGQEVFGRTLRAMKAGGEFPTNLRMTQFRRIAPLPTAAAQIKIGEIEEVFGEFNRVVVAFLDADVGSNEYRNLRQKMLELANRLRHTSDELVVIATETAERNQLQLYWSIVVMGLFIVMMVWLAYLALNRLVVIPLSRLAGTLQDIEENGDLSTRLAIRSNDEVGQAIGALNKLLESLQTAIADTNEAMQKAAHGNFSARIASNFKGHLNLLKGNVNSQIEALGDNIERIEAVTKFREMVQESDSLEAFGQSIMNRLCRALGVPLGALYIRRRESGAFELIGEYAGSPRALPSDRHPAHGLLAQCAADNRAILVDHLPADYLQVVSGLGAAPPNALLLLPIDYQREVLAVIELASFAPLHANQLEFLEELRPIIGLGMENILRYEQSQSLLAETRQASERLMERQEASSALSDILRSGLEPLSLEAHFAAVLDRLSSIPWLAQLRKGVLYLYDEEENLLVRHAVKGFARDERGQGCERIMLGQCHCGRAGAERRVAYADYQDKGGGLCSPDGVSEPGHYCLPLTSGEQLLGVLHLYVPAGFERKPMVEEFLQSVATALASIVERKSVDAKLLAAKEAAEAANKSKSDFLANVSHEIRTPMNAIIGLSHLASLTGLDDKQRNYVDKIQSSAFSLLGIVNDILDFSKIEAGKLDLEAIPFELDKMLGSVADLVAGKAHEKGLEMILARHADVPNDLVGDQLRLAQILTNLANNAVKFTENGEIVIECSELRRAGNRIELQFSVSDTGIGMSAEQAEKLFQPFIQADMSTTRRFGGTGLGLSICRRLVDMMEGRIWIDSEFGQGSRFFFTVWLGLRDPADASGPGAQTELQGLRALVVTEHRRLGESVVAMLQSLTLASPVALTMAAARDAIAQAAGDASFDLALIDWRACGEPGFQSIRDLQLLMPAGQRMKVILMADVGFDLSAHDMCGARIDTIVTKPLTPSVTFEAILKLFVSAQHAGIGTPDVDQETELGRLRGARILLAEDNRINQQIAVELLERKGLIVKVAENGETAARLAAEETFDLILMDIQMPVMDGFAATEAIRRIPACAALPILAMTALAMTGDREKSLAAGMNDHLTKPIDPEQLYAALLRWIPYRREAAVGKDASSTVAPVFAGDDQATRLVSTAGSLIDTQRGLYRVDGNERLYRKLLGDFREDFSDATERLQAAMAAERFDDIRQLAHSIKGVAGAIGATALQATAAGLEEAARDGQTGVLQDGLAAFGPGLSAVLAEIQTIVGMPTTAVAQADAAPELPEAAVDSLLDDLEAALAAGQSRSLELFERVRPVLARWLGETGLATLSDQIDGFDYSDALATLRDARKAGKQEQSDENSGGTI